ncbi:MAG: error-prone DNA polymerase [Hyphomonadaceae bacterium]
MSAFAELAIETNFSFLRAASHPEEIVEHAKALGLAGIGVADRLTLAGIVRAHVAAKEHDVPLIVGARLAFTDGAPEIAAYPRDRAAYARLTRLLTIGNRRAPKGECWLMHEDFLAHAEGLQAIVFAEDESAAPFLEEIKRAAGAVWLAAPMRYDGADARRLRILAALAKKTGARLIATSAPLIHAAERKPLLDVVTCIREKTTLEAAGRRLEANAERHMKSAAEMARLYRAAPDAVAESVRFFNGVEFSLEQLRYEYPTETVEGYPSAQEALEALTWEGARRRYPDGVPEKVKQSLKRELAIVAELKYAPYFLTVADIVRFARGKEDKDGNARDPILCQGRGSAANSTICYCLGVTEVDPAINELLFDRFISAERGEPPDIDVDFEHERREDAIQYVYRKYGRHRAGLTANLVCYRGRSAIREVGKVFGFSEDRIAALAKTQQWWSAGVESEDLKRLGLDLADPQLAACLKLARELRGFPRHLSQHVGGFVITRERLDDVVPIQNAAMEDRTVIEWNKDDIEALGILKVDLLGLGMLTMLRKAFDMIRACYGRDLDLTNVPKEEPEIYAMLQRADSVGVFQVESRAQMSMLPRLRPECFYDLVIEVAIVRPGPIQGGMVHPYLKRKQGLEPVTYPSKALEAVLKRTLGVPLFQEQAMQIAIVGAGFSPPEADKLRRAMATFRRVGTIGQLKTKFIEGMVANGYTRDFAEASFRQIEGFGEYGFPESHAASFAILVYASSWVKCHYPDVFAASLLNAQPMGFYAPAQIVRDAEEHGVETRAPDVNLSDWDCTIEPDARLKPINPRHVSMAEDIFTTHALRLGLRQIKGLAEEEMKLLMARRGRGYDSVRDLWLRTGLPADAVEKLADADAFRSIGLDRRDALWAARGLGRVGGQDDLPLFAQTHDPTREPDYALPSMPLGEHVVEDYRTLGLSLKAHPTSFLRNALAARGVTRAEDLANVRDGVRVRVAGLVLVRQRPGTASGVIFMTLEDDTHIANIIVWPKMFEQFRPQVLGARLALVEGRLQSERGVIHIIAERIADESALLTQLSHDGPEVEALARADEVKRPDPGSWRDRDQRGARAMKAMPQGRNFH